MQIGDRQPSWTSVTEVSDRPRSSGYPTHVLSLGLNETEFWAKVRSHGLSPLHMAWFSYLSAPADPCLETSSKSEHFGYAWRIIEGIFFPVGATPDELTCYCRDHA